MSTNILRTADGWFVVRGDSAVAIDTKAATTAELLADRVAVAQAADSHDIGTPVADLVPLAPVTTPCRVVAQMVNYRSHARESGFTGEIPPTFFRKASGSVCGPSEATVRPPHVQFLDYEVELGLVIGAPLPVGTVVEEQDLPRFVAGLVLCNDVSARDVQLTKGQFYESKSYPTFTPVGPYLVLLDEQDFAHLQDIRLRLCVNGEMRQDRTLADMITRPARALTVLSRFQALEPGDLLLTGTPGGTALQAPPKPVEKLAALLPPRIKWKAFFNSQRKNPRYLRTGDQVTATAATADGRIDLGEQRTPVTEGQGHGR
ncbi:fumarylacetoacetate hydrolase family protein [Streptacidiphilus neutrinimicus]|uniref:fumarylacetoacetate hydrolase family protein n=1 Tax=Streptacidiphilus neutrinimicus TaxID=105420 RepID=UPI0005A7CD2F|nr:fumarylacetoacetate hydrolase family protein [Streptacidiphilus neutrinimicus]